MAYRVRKTANGKITGNGYEADCIVGFDEVTLPGTSINARAKFSVQSTSIELPDGIYDIQLQGEAKSRIRKNGMFWVAA